MAFQRPDARRPRRDGGSERPSFNPNFSAGGGDRDRGSDRGDRRPSGPRTPGGRPPQGGGGGGGGFRPGGGGSDNRRDDRGGSSDRGDRGGFRPNTGPGGFGGGSGGGGNGRSFSKPGSDRFSGPERGGFKGPRGGNDRDSDRPRSYGPPRDDRFSAPRPFSPPRLDDRARFDDSAPDDRPVRPARDARPSGQPMRNSEGRAVPHGQTGERNRKFVKPQAPNDPRPVTPARFQDRPGSRPDNDNRDQRSGRFEADRPRPYSPPRDGGARPGKHDARANGNRGFGSDRRKPEERNFDNRAREERRMAGGWQPERIFQQQQQQQQENRPGRGGHPQNVDFERGPEAPRRMAGSERGPRSWADRRFGSADRSSQFEAPTYNLKKFSNDRGGSKAKKRSSGDDYSEPKEGIRLNRYIANAGVCSRREADALIAAGEIRINGEIVMEMGYIVKPEDSVQYGKRSLKREKLVYVLLNKPKDHITTTDDPEERKTVMDLVGNASKERIFPVGRLDRNTTGLLLFTNDGELAQKLTHPSHRMQKIYQVELDKALSADHFTQIRDGLMLEDGKIEVDDLAVVAGNERFVGIELHSGRNRIVRRIFEHLGYDVVTLDRVQYAGLTKKDLPRGNWRYLTQQEVVRLKFMQ